MAIKNLVVPKGSIDIGTQTRLIEMET